MLKNYLHKYIYIILIIFNFISNINSQEQRGIAYPELKATVETTAQIMERKKSHDVGTKKVYHHKIRLKNKVLLTNSNSLNVSSYANQLYSKNFSPDSKTQLLPVPKAAGDISLTFEAANYNQSGYYPPDSMGHVGTTQFIVCVNGIIKSFNKNTGQPDGVLNTSLNNFFTTVEGTSDVFDPRIRYDKFAGKWIVTGLTRGNPNRIVIATSNTGTITSSTQWSFYYLQHDQIQPAGDTGLFADYNTLGIDANALYLGFNLFDTSNTYIDSTGYVIRKSSVYNSGTIQAWAFRDIGTSGLVTPQGVDNLDANQTSGYFIGVDSLSSNRLVLRQISNLSTTPTISGNIYVTVPTISEPLTVPHKGNTGGTNGNLDGGDTRLISAHIRNGKLWTTHAIAVDNTGAVGSTLTRNGCRWYQIDLTTTTPTLIQSGTVFTQSSTNLTDQRYYWMPSIMTNDNEDAVLGCSAAGQNEYTNCAIAYRLKSDPLGTLRGPVLYTNNTANAYNPTYDSGADGARRWGDYSYTSVDTDGNTFYSIQEFAGSPNIWSVQVAKVLGSTTVVVPVAPTLNPITVSSATPRNYTVSWNSVANATSYTLQQSTNSSFTNAINIATGNIQSVSITNQPDGTYYYRVYASNSAGNSPYSNVQSVSISANIIAPTLNPITVNSSISGNNYTLSWSAVANATSYTLQQSTNSSFTNPVIIVQGNALSYTFTNQVNGTYYYRVYASNAGGNSPYSNVQNITISSTSTVQLNASYTVVNDLGTSYQVQVKLTNPTNSILCGWSGNFSLKNQETISYLWDANYIVNGTSVQFRNAAWNGMIPSFGSITFEFVISNAQPGIRSFTDLTASAQKSTCNC